MKPMGITVAANGDFYVADAGSSIISVYSPGSFTPRAVIEIPASGTIGSAKWGSPIAVAVAANGDIYYSSASGGIFKISGGTTGDYRTGNYPVPFWVSDSVVTNLDFGHGC